MKNAMWAALGWILIGLVMLWTLVGCASSQSQKMQMIWLDDECFLYIDGMQAEQAEELQKDWSMERCNIAVRSKGGTEKNPSPQPVQEGEG